MAGLTIDGYRPEIGVSEDQGSVVFSIDLEGREGAGGWHRPPARVDEILAEVDAGFRGRLSGSDLVLLVEEIRKLREEVGGSEQISRALEPGDARALAAALEFAAKEALRYAS